MTSLPLQMSGHFTCTDTANRWDHTSMWGENTETLEHRSISAMDDILHLLICIESLDGLLDPDEYLVAVLHFRIILVQPLYILL